MRILVADDDATYRMLLARELSRSGYEVELVSDGAGALASLTSPQGPVLAILDWQMPVMDGLEVCRRVRAETEGRYIYMLLVTANTTSEELLAGLDAGADDYLPKPVNLAELQMRIRAGCRILEFESRSRQLFENAPTAYHEANTDGVIVRVNRAEYELLGYGAGDLLGSRVWDFVSPEQLEHRKSAFIAAIQAQDERIEDSEWELHHRDGSLLQVRLQQNRILDGPRVTGIRCTMVDITELRRQQELLRRQSKDLERSNAELEQFAYVASHDLQEPLRMITGFVQLLAGRYTGHLDAKADQYIGFIVDGAKRMQCLISDILALSRVGSRGAEFQDVDLDDVLSEVLVNLKPKVNEEGATVTHEPLPAVVADRGQMSQLLQNLIGNAMKFHGTEPPRVHISAVENEQGWTVSVNDNGIGIAPQHSDRVFQIFQRLHTREKYSGTGIGLAICRKIVERHNGRIWYDSVPGSGTTFRFTMPHQLRLRPVQQEPANRVSQLQ